MEPAVVVLVLFTIYFLPTLITLMRHRHNRLAIFILNLLLGWTLLGWIVAMVWAFLRSHPRDERNHPSVGG